MPPNKVSSQPSLNFLKEAAASLIKSNNDTIESTEKSPSEKLRAEYDNERRLLMEIVEQVKKDLLRAASNSPAVSTIGSTA